MCANIHVNWSSTERGVTSKCLRKVDIYVYSYTRMCTRVHTHTHERERSSYNGYASGEAGSIHSCSERTSGLPFTISHLPFTILLPGRTCCETLFLSLVREKPAGRSAAKTGVFQARNREYSESRIFRWAHWDHSTAKKLFAPSVFYRV